MLKSFILLLAFAASLAAAYNMTNYTYKTIGDLKISLHVYTPPSPAPASGYPVLFAIHGGAYLIGSKERIPTNQELAEAMKRGWVVVSVNYRLFPHVFLEDAFADVQDAYQWVRTKLVKKTPINPDAITVFGQSAGGGLAVLCGYKLSPLPVAIIGMYPSRPNWTDPFSYDPKVPFDPSVVALAKKLSGGNVLTEYTSYKSSKDPRIVLWHSSQGNRKFGWLAVTHDQSYPADKILKKLKELSASENIDKNYPPTYLAHGLADNTVTYKQSVQMANSLKRNNVPYVLDLVPNADHGFDRIESFWPHVLPAFDFVQKYMQPKAQVKFLQK